MKYYTSTTEFNCGIDLPARQMYVCVMDRQGKKLVHTNVKDNDFAFFLKLVQPYRHDLTVCCECMFGWYWLADACQAAGLTFVLAHALYVKAIHGGKNKNDRIDSEKLTHLLRSNLIPPAYVYPAEKRPLRALLRQRIFYVWRRAELLARIHSHQLAHNRVPAKHVAVRAFSWGLERNGDELDRGGRFVGPERFRYCSGKLIQVFREASKYGRTCLKESGLLVCAAALAGCIGTVATFVMPALRERRVSECSVSCVWSVD